MNMDSEKTIYELVETISANTSATKENVADIEQKILTMKERYQCVVSITPFKYLHKLLITNIV